MNFRNRLQTLVDAPAFSRFIIVLIVLNAISLGLETWPAAMAAAGGFLLWFDRTALIVFTIEIGLRLWAHRGDFFRDPWSIFDFSIVAIAWLPASGPLAVLRALRILRVLRLMSIVPQMKKVVGALLYALPGMGSILAVLLLLYYVAAVMATNLFGAEFPDWFGSIGASMFSLFQIMTLESWSMGIVRPVMEVYPLAWAFFVPFIVITTFAVLNLFIALVVNSMQSLQEETARNFATEATLAHDERVALHRQLDDISAQIQQLRSSLRVTAE